ncbi:MAG: hypothetical protein EOP43_06260 [Sphingobacteriaceae bacterium]|nr:MAG: hypothetical protein EOP43_06260 [Sphingobacteriaceae bacterium]
MLQVVFVRANLVCAKMSLQVGRLVRLNYLQRKRLGEELEFEIRPPKPKLNKSSKVDASFTS